MGERSLVVLVEWGKLEVGRQICRGTEHWLESWTARRLWCCPGREETRWLRRIREVQEQAPEGEAGLC